MIVVQNRLSRALRLAGKLIHRWDKAEFEQPDPALAAAEERGEVWCTPSQLPAPLPPQKMVLQSKTSPPEKVGTNGQRREARGSVLGHRR